MITRVLAPDEILLIAVRHGETESNAAHRFIGQCDSPLSAVGRRQVDVLGKRLQDEAIDRIHASDLGRAAQTADEIARHHPIDPIQDARLRERHYGALEGLSFGESKERFPEVFAAFDRFETDVPIPGGESAQQVRDRISAFVQESIAPHAGQTHLVVCHGGIVRALLWHLLDVPYRAARYARSDNASLSVFRFFRGAWHLERWNDTGHLLDLG
jgi:probable phosphoglycerate mutase